MILCYTKQFRNTHHNLNTEQKEWMDMTKHLIYDETTGLTALKYNYAKLINLIKLT